MFFKQNRKQVISSVLLVLVLALVGDRLITVPWVWLVFLLALLIGIIAYLIVLFDHHTYQLERTHHQEITFKDRSQALMKQRFETLITYLPYPLVLIDQYGNILLTNDTFKLLLQNEDDQLTIRSKAIPLLLRRLLNDIYLNERSMTTTLTLSQTDYQVVSIPIVQNDRYQGCLVVLQDITRLLHQERIQKRFLADASHELKTPITAIKGMVEILNRKGFNDDDTRNEFTHQIAIETDRLNTIVKDLLYLSKLSNQTVLLNKQPLDMHAVVMEAVQSLRLKITEKNMDVEVFHDDQDPVLADPSSMLTVLINLIDNAITYSGSKKLIVHIKGNDTQKIIEVTDFGIGIKKKDLPHIFERFYRVDDDRNRQSGGSGLGLSIVKELIEAHQGTIEASSTTDQQTTFTITLSKLTKT